MVGKAVVGRVLLVDDDMGIQGYVSRTLQRLGYLVTCTSGFPGARVAVGPFDLVICDLGCDADAVRDYWSGVPMLTISGNHGAELSKPFGPKALGLAVAAKLGRS